MIPGLCDDNGRIGVLAIDHRDSLRAVINPEAPDTVGPIRDRGVEEADLG